MKNIIYKIGDLMNEAVFGEARLNYQREALLENKCTEASTFGLWIDFFDVNYLISLLHLEEEDFREAFPNAGSFPKNRRLEAAAAIEEHFVRCGHCALKRGYDHEEGDRMTAFCRENRESLLEILESSETAEGDHLTATA